MLLVDTGALVGLADPRDSYHSQAKQAFAEIGTSERLVTTDYVFDEAVTLLRARAGHAVAVEFGKRIRASTWLTVDRLSPQDLEEAWQIFRRFKDHKLSFTDCTTAAYARRNELTRVFTFDKGFKALGLTSAP